MNFKATLAPLALAACIGLAACGGDDKKNNGDNGGKLSRSELATKATAICKTALADAQKVQTPTNLADAAAAEKYFTAIAAGTQKQTNALTALTPDDEAKADWDAYIAAQNKATHLLNATRNAARDKDPAGLTAFQTDAPAISQAVDAAGKKVGIKNCG
jgi:SRSO17 transposase